MNAKNDIRDKERTKVAWDIHVSNKINIIEEFAIFSWNLISKGKSNNTGNISQTYIHLNDFIGRIDLPFFRPLLMQWCNISVFF